MSRLSPLSLDGLRSCIRPEYAGLPQEDLEGVIESAVSGLPTDTAEDFLKTLASVGKAVGPALQRAAPGLAQGAATGASVGGPWGALIGAGAGLASSLLTKEKPAQPTASPTATGTPAMRAAPALPTGQGAAATLLSLLQNPTVQQALLSQVLGSAGGQQIVTASGTSLPRGAINSLLTQLLANASEALPESESISEQSYLQDASGEFLVDPASLDQQAALVLSHLQRTRAATIRDHDDKFMEAAEVEWMEDDVAETESAVWGDSGEMPQFY